MGESWAKHGTVSSLCWMERDKLEAIKSLLRILFIFNYPFTSPAVFISGLLLVGHGDVSDSFLPLWATRISVYFTLKGSRTTQSMFGIFLQHQHKCTGCGSDDSQQFLQHKELRWPCSCLLLILLLVSAALRGLQPHFYWKSFAVIKPFSLWLGYCSHKSSYWALGNSLIFVLLCYF